MKALITVFEDNFKLIDSDNEFNYQKDLTNRLDKIDKPFDQALINEIVLWKLNRFAEVDVDILNAINDIDTHTKVLDLNKTRNILFMLLKKKGIKLPIASSILRFRNKNIYQIIDQRVYRILYKEENLKLRKNSEEDLKQQIELYLKYLTDLRFVCEKLTIPFCDSDRILYMADKRINKGIPLSNYSNKTNV
jgi:hypothetical protein